MMRGFSGHLPPEQLLYLWDLVLGYDSLEIIPLLAVTILSFRKENLMQVNTLHNVEVRLNLYFLQESPFRLNCETTCYFDFQAVLADLSSLKVMPLLQLSLLKD